MEVLYSTELVDLFCTNEDECTHMIYSPTSMKTVQNDTTATTTSSPSSSSINVDTNASFFLYKGLASTLPSELVVHHQRKNYHQVSNPRDDNCYSSSSINDALVVKEQEQGKEEDSITEEREEPETEVGERLQKYHHPYNSSCMMNNDGNKSTTLVDKVNYKNDSQNHDDDNEDNENYDLSSVKTELTNNTTTYYKDQRRTSLSSLSNTRHNMGEFPSSLLSSSYYFALPFPSKQMDEADFDEAADQPAIERGPSGNASSLSTSLPKTGIRTASTHLNAVQLRLLAAASPEKKKRKTKKGMQRMSKTVLPSSNKNKNFNVTTTFVDNPSVITSRAADRINKDNSIDLSSNNGRINIGSNSNGSGNHSTTNSFTPVIKPEARCLQSSPSHPSSEPSSVIIDYDSSNESNSSNFKSTVHPDYLISSRSCASSPDLLLSSSAPPPSSVQVILPYKEFEEDLNLNLETSNGKFFQRRAPTKNHDSQVMIRLNKKRFIIIDYSIVPNKHDVEASQNDPHIRIPIGAGKKVCLGSTILTGSNSNDPTSSSSVPCTKIGVPVVLYDSEPQAELSSAYVKNGLCFTCQRKKNESNRARERLRVAKKKQQKLLELEQKHYHSTKTTNTTGTTKNGYNASSRKEVSPSPNHRPNIATSTSCKNAPPVKSNKDNKHDNNGAYYSPFTSTSLSLVKMNYKRKRSSSFSSSNSSKRRTQVTTSLRAWSLASSLSPCNIKGRLVNKTDNRKRIEVIDLQSSDEE